MNPVNAIHEWFTKLPMEHRHEIAFFTLALLPDYPITKAMGTDNLVNNFLEWLLSEEESKHHAVGRALFVRAVVNLNLVSRADDSEWEKTNAFFEYVKNTADENTPPGIIETSTHQQERIALRKRQWKKTIEEWSNLLNGPLSDDQLNHWLSPIS